MYSSFLNLIDILGTFAFAVSGVFSAMEKRLDIFGVFMISFATAIGGGTIRDVMVGNLPVSWLQNSLTIVVIFVAALVTMVFGSYLKHLNTALFLFDALGLGLFTIIGIEVGLKKEFGPGISIALGTISACFGGVLRDVLLNKIPLLFHKEIYALACVAGGIAYFGLKQTALNDDVAKIICILFIFFLRVVAVRCNWSLPRITLKQ